MKHKAFAALVLVLLSSPSLAEGTRVEAENLEHKAGVYTLTGSARVEEDDATITADRIVYDENTGETVAEGSVFYDDPKVTIRAETAEMNLTTKTGVIYDSYLFIKQDGYHVRSPEMHKRAEDRYFLRKASATTCDGPLPAWCIAGNDIDIIVGERLKMWHATLRVKNIPVFYYPYFWIPIVAERRTGILNPELGYRKTLGAIVRQPFFWAIADNRDATFTLDVYTKRGLAEGAEYRYVERPDMSGEFSLYHARDGDINRDYYEFRGRHRQSVGFLDVNVLNYREFYRVYETYLEDSSLRFLESQAEAFAPIGTSRLYLAARYLQDLKDGVDQDTLPQRLPEAGFFLSPHALGPVVVSGTTSATNMERDEGTDGQRYEAGLTALHSVGRGITFSQALSALSLYYALEDTGEGWEEGFHNALYDYDATLHLILERNYGSIRHELEPSLSYQYVERDGEEPELFDSLEDISEKSFASLSVSNRLKDGKGGLLTLKLTQDFDLEESERPFRPLLAELTLKRPVYVATSITLNTDDGRVETMSTNATLTFGRASFTAAQTLDEPSDVKTYKLTAGYEVSSRLALESSVSYDDAEEKGVEEFSFSVDYQSQCWGLALTVVDERDDFGVFVQVSLLGLGTYRAEVFSVEEAAE
jgi:LPS-assembly protein